MSHTKKTCLIVEDEFLNAEYFRELVEGLGIEVCEVVSTAHHAVQCALEYRPTFILMDVRLDGDRDGIMVAAEIKQQLDVQIVFITGSTEPSTLERVRRNVDYCLLVKPIAPHMLQRALSGP